MASKHRYCPSWLYDCVVADVCSQFIKDRRDLGALANNYAVNLSQHYMEMSREELARSSEEVMQFLIHIGGSNGEDLLSSFSFFRFYFVTKTQKRAWITVGPGLLTRIYNNGKFNDLTIFPSYYFLPIHCTGLEYKGHSKIYAYQEWGSTKQNYDIMNKINLPEQFNSPNFSVTILMPFYNGNAAHLKQCFESIKHQEGCYYIDFIIINDGSNNLSTLILKKMLDYLKNTSRWINIHYIENEKNMGLGYSLNKGVVLSDNEYIFRMDADDIMITNRIVKQLEFMTINKDCVLCGGQVKMFEAKDGDNNNFNIINETNHPSLDWKTFCEKRPHWIMNHPTFCFRKSTIINVGNYDSSQHSMCEDFDLIIRVLKKYGKIYNLEDTLLLYRIHENQLTYKGGVKGRGYWSNYRHKLIDKYINKENIILEEVHG